MAQEFYPNDFILQGPLIAESSILSGNSELYSLFGSLDIQTSLQNSVSSYSDVSTVVIANSAFWSAGGNAIDNGVRALSSNWQETYLNQSNYFPLSGGVVSGQTRFNDNVTIFGNLSCSGTQTFSNTIFATTSSLSVVHVGSGPALYVGNNGNGDIASFYDIDQDVEVLHVGGNNGSFPNVGVKTSQPNKDFTVNGEISAKGNIWTNGDILSGGQELLGLIQPSIANVYNTVNANSATIWSYQGTDLKGLSANWQETCTIVQANSASWAVDSTIDSQVRALTSEWSSTYSTVRSNSATTWNYQGTDLKSLSSNWESTFATVQSNSATNWNYQGTDLKDLSANWQETCTIVQTNSASWAIDSTIDTEVRALTSEWSSVYSSVANASGNWDSVYSHVNANSAANWNYQGTDLKDLSANWENTFSTVQTNSASWAIDSTIDTDVRTLTSYWDSTYSTVQTNSATTWNYQGTDLKDLSANWQAAYTEVQSNSALWASNIDVDLRSLSANWQNTYTDFNAQSANNISVYSSVTNASANWDSVYSIVQTNSATNWNYQGTDLKDLSANWQDTYTTVQSNSASWAIDSTIDTEVRALTSNWQNTYTDFSTQSANNISVYSTVQTNSATYVKTVATTAPGTSAVSTIIAVSALPVSPDPNTLYIVI